MNDQCFIWARHLDNKGYGQWTTVINGKRPKPHRVMYEQVHGSIPEDLVIDHLCRNRACINPEHLEAVTCKENILRGESIQAKNAKKTHCKRGHIFNRANTRIDKNGGRVCRVCMRMYQRAWKADRH